MSSLPRHSLSKRRVSFRYRVSLRLWRTAVMKRDVKLSLQGHRPFRVVIRTSPATFVTLLDSFRVKLRERRRERGGETFHISRRHDPSLSLSLYPLSIIWYDVWHIPGQSCNEIFSFSNTCSLPPHVLC